MESADRRDQTLRNQGTLKTTANCHVRSTHPQTPHRRARMNLIMRSQRMNRTSWYAHPGASETCLSRQVTFCCPVCSGLTRLMPPVLTFLPRSTPVWLGCERMSSHDQPNTQL